MVLGITHPVERKHNGEKYRHSLESLVKKLKLTRNVLFIDALGRQMGWGNVSKEYLKIFTDVVKLANREIPVEQEIMHMQSGGLINCQAL